MSFTEILRAQTALAQRPDGDVAARILGAALAAVDPVAAVHRAVSVDSQGLRAGEHRVPLHAASRVWCIAVGKAAGPMAGALAARLGTRLHGGVVVTKQLHEAARGSGLPVVVGAHPVPDERSVQAGEAVLDVLGQVAAHDVVLVLLSGGASSLMVAPESGLDLRQLRPLGEALVRSGASIEEINAVRAPLDRLKGGGLARRAQPATVVTLVLDDVVGAPLHVVGSGPTLPTPEGGPDPLVVLGRYGIVPSEQVALALARTAPSVGGNGPVVRLAGNDTAVTAAIAQAKAEGWDARAWPTLHGDVREVGPRLATLLARATVSRPTAWLGGGETTITVRGTGRGGRNQALALAAAPTLASARGRLMVTLATDGEDGPTDAAGAVIDGRSLARAEAEGLDMGDHLANDDAYPVFEALGDLLRIGPTGTNVCDLALGLVRP